VSQKRIKPTLKQSEVKPSPQERVLERTRHQQRPSKTDRPRVNREDQARPFRPLSRAPIAIVEILDDGAETGECVRIRSDAITIGREDADILVPHDSQISGTHARISRRLTGGVYHWYLTDLDSTNGTFLRVAKASLVEGQLILMGSYRYVFRTAQATVPDTDSATAGEKGTSGWQTVMAANPAQLTPTLVRLNPDGSEHSFAVDGDDLLIGQSAEACKIVVSDDPAISTVHARVYRSEDGGFLIEDAKSLNGVWMANRERRLSKSSQFQLGDQRFRLRIPTWK
jgi:pSer/pThr/pTyr-binding forkhead associated (FHA) protein